MKTIRTIIKIFTGITFIGCIGVFILIYNLRENVPEKYKVFPAEDFHIESPVPVTAVLKGEKDNKNAHSSGESYDVSLKMFGIIPFTNAKIQVIDRMQVAVLGKPFGMKLYTDGVLVSELQSVSTDNGEKSPAKQSDIRVGDYIKSVDGTEITCNEDLSELVATGEGKSMEFTVIRNGKKIIKTVTPVMEKDGRYRVGLWVKDSSAGIGTLTFYSPADKVICGLGHGVCDEESDKILTLNKGQLVSAKIVGVTRGKDGEPGELKGRFTGTTLSENLKNNTCGVYGKLCGELDFDELVEVAPKQEVSDGNAEILTTINGDTPKLYSCKIYVRKSRMNSKTQNMVITVTDKDLLNKTGGIVQGMSGSPILQNGKLIGAVTHVLVDDSTKGYGIFAQTMLEISNKTAGKTQIKKAS